MVLEIHMKLCVTRPNFYCKKNTAQNKPNVGFFEVIENFSHFGYYLFCNWSVMKGLYHLLRSCTNPRPGVNLFP